MKISLPPSLKLFYLIIITAVISLPSGAMSFEAASKEKGQCSRCHTIDNNEAQEILKDLVSEVHGVELSEVPGLYIIDATGQNGKRGILYMDFSKSYVVVGTFISISDKKNVTQREISRLRRVDVSSIPLGDSIVLGDPAAPRKLILFTDPQCPFCKKLHPELERVVKANPGIVFYIKMLPLVKLHPDSMRISKSILCQKSVELLEASFAGKKIPDPACQSDAVEKTVKLAQELGIGSTPTLVLPDGRILPGYRPAEDIIEQLERP